MTSDEAHTLAGKYGLEFRFDQDGQSWELGKPGRDASVWIAPHVLSGLTSDQLINHYINEVLGRAGGGDAAGED